MLLGAIAAIIIANSAYYAGFTEFWETDLLIGFGASTASMSLAEIINDIFMAIFFLLVGLEIKYEMTVRGTNQHQTSHFACCGSFWRCSCSYYYLSCL